MLGKWGASGPEGWSYYIVLHWWLVCLSGNIYRTTAMIKTGAVLLLLALVGPYASQGVRTILLKKENLWIIVLIVARCVGIQEQSELPVWMWVPWHKRHKMHVWLRVPKTRIKLWTRLYSSLSFCWWNLPRGLLSSLPRRPYSRWKSRPSWTWGQGNINIFLPFGLSGHFRMHTLWVMILNVRAQMWNVHSALTWLLTAHPWQALPQNAAQKRPNVVAKPSPS